MSQKGIPVYSGKMRASDLLELSAIDEWKENHLTKGYQREQFEDKADDISVYLEMCPIAMVPGVLASLREEHDFTPVRGDLGILHVPNVKGSLYLMDGQQRTGGIQRVRAHYQELLERKGDLSKDEQRESQALKELLDSYEVPVTFVDTRMVMERIRELAPPDMKIEPSHAEMAYFFIVNKTQKAVNPSLKDQLAYNIVRANIGGIPVIEREKWRAAAVPVVNALREEQIAYLKAYWNVVQKLWPKAFAEATKKEWLVLKTIGVYSLNRLANDVFNWCHAKTAKVPNEKDIEPYLAPLKATDWTRDSTFAAYGGQKGVRVVYDTLVRTLDDAGITEARSIMEQPPKRRGRKKKED